MLAGGGQDARDVALVGVTLMIIAATSISAQLIAHPRPARMLISPGLVPTDSFNQYCHRCISDFIPT